MYLLDTNIVSEIRKIKSGKADKNLAAWTNASTASSFYISVITVLEIETGVLLLERRDAAQASILRSWFNEHVLPVFSDRILPIDTAVAKCCAKLHVPDPRSDRDALIAATALTHGMPVVTRNVSDFKSMGVKMINPFSQTDCQPVQP
jgi:toxin FitB